MLTVDKLNENDAKTIEEAAKQMLAIKDEIEKLRKMLEPYKLLYFPMIDGPTCPIDYEIFDEFDGMLNSDVLMWFDEAEELLRHIAVSIRAYPIIENALLMSVE